MDILKFIFKSIQPHLIIVDKQEGATTMARHTNDISFKCPAGLKLQLTSFKQDNLGNNKKKQRKEGVFMFTDYIGLEKNKRLRMKKG